MKTQQERLAYHRDHEEYGPLLKKYDCYGDDYMEKMFGLLHDANCYKQYTETLSQDLMEKDIALQGIVYKLLEQDFDGAKKLAHQIQSCISYGHYEGEKSDKLKIKFGWEEYD